MCQSGPSPRNHRHRAAAPCPGDEATSSSALRSAIKRGRFRRPYTIDLAIVRESDSTHHGFPTANIATAPRSAATAASRRRLCRRHNTRRRGNPRRAIVNIGLRPVDNSTEPARTIESHIPRLRTPTSTAHTSLTFLRRLRPERRFLDALRAGSPSTPRPPEPSKICTFAVHYYLCNNRITFSDTMDLTIKTIDISESSWTP